MTFRANPPPSFYQRKGGNGLSATSKLDHQRVQVFQSHLTLSKYSALIAISSFEGRSRENAHRRTWKSSNQTQIIFSMLKKKQQQPKNGKKKPTLSNSRLTAIAIAKTNYLVSCVSSPWKHNSPEHINRSILPSALSLLPSWRRKLYYRHVLNQHQQVWSSLVKHLQHVSVDNRIYHTHLLYRQNSYRFWQDSCLSKRLKDLGQTFRSCLTHKYPLLSYICS